MSSGPHDGYRNARMLDGLDLRALRLAGGIKLKTVAAALGVSRTAVHNWEAGLSRPSGERGAAYARFVLGLARHAAVSRG